MAFKFSPPGEGNEVQLATTTVPAFSWLSGRHVGLRPVMHGQAESSDPLLTVLSHFAHFTILYICTFIHEQ
jgi:hypothetical protein